MIKHPILKNFFVRERLNDQLNKSLGNSHLCLPFHSAIMTCVKFWLTKLANNKLILAEVRNDLFATNLN